MNKKIYNWLSGLIFAVSVGVTFVIVLPMTVSAAPAPPTDSGTSTCSDTLLTFPAWFKGLTDGSCNIKSPTDAGGLSTFIWTIVLNIIEMCLQLVGYIAAGFIIRGGFKYMTSVGEPAEVAKAKKMMTDAIIGLILSIFSVAIVNLVSGAIK
ncbi:MAG TPA: pilin [Candidatus Chromulinivoraceae bacterium]|nr:pilin [Candidatus Chromulinivoraceae bacterium]